MYTKMIDIVNFQVKGYPVMMYGMMAVTIGALTFATVSGLKMPSMPTLSSMMSDPTQAPPANGLGPTNEPTMSNPLTPASTTPIPPSQGGKHKHNNSSKRKKHRPTSKGKTAKAKKQSK